MKETSDAQNILVRLEREVYLNVSKPGIKLKRQYHKAQQALSKAVHEFDILNDMKEAALKK